ncbi:hypothetical protein AGMMS49546_00940 [Spirochaetia bacterium]|nr:hypothetical protein AGMMS49546_00940 [Spirochaetia bacterium]
MDTAAGLCDANQYYIITLGDLAITNAGRQTVVSFRVPSDTQHIDYTKGR